MDVHGGAGRGLDPDDIAELGAAEPLARLDRAYAEVRDSVAGAIGDALALAEQIRSEARGRAIRAAAEEAANEIERVSARRQEQLRSEARLLEERKLRVLDSLRDIAVQLENVDPPSGEMPAREGRAEY